MRQSRKKGVKDRERRQIVVVALLVFIIALLAIVILLIPERSESAESSVATETGTEEQIEPTPPLEVDKPQWRLYFIIDDVGNNLSQLEPFLELPFPLTFAIMPKRPFTAESAERISKLGFNIILHQPMEPVGDANPGEGAIFTDMDAERIREILDENLASLPDAIGVNNHMGSRATADPGVMSTILEYLAQKELFFVDSVTTEHVVGRDIAVKLQVDYTKRNTLFLDNQDDEEKIRELIISGTEVAKRDGNAVLIGHVQTPSLASILADMYDELSEQGFTFSGIQDYQFIDDGRIQATIKQE